MKKLLLALVTIACSATFCIAAETHGNKELQAACKGLAIGKFCGMKHEH